jgi:hypothetical protein
MAIDIHVGANTRKASRELKTFEKKTKGIASSIAKGFKERIGHKLLDGLKGAVRDIPQLINTAVTTASDLNEEISKSEVIFGKSAGSIRDFAQTTIESLGLSELATMRATGQFGTLFKTMGMIPQKAADMSKEMTKLAADLGSFHNTTTEDAIGAIGAALRGESEPIRRYGVLLNEATLKAEAFEQGLYDGKGALDPATKALASYSVILKQTGDAQGDFARTSDGLAGQKKILAARFEELTVAVGEAFLPVIKDAVTLLNEIPLNDAVDFIDTLAVGFGKLGGVISDAWSFLLKFNEALVFVTPGGSTIQDFITGGFSTTEKDTPEIDEPDWMNPKEEELSEGEQAEKDFTAEQDKIWDASVAKEAEMKKFRDEEKKMMKEHDQMEKAAMHAEREKNERLEEQRKKKEEILAIEKEQAKIDKTMDQVSDIQSSLNASMSRSSITAASSMQSIGGGGGVAGELNLQKTQTSLQRELVGLQQQMVVLLEGVKTGVSQDHI